MSQSELKLFAATVPGLEPLLVEELNALAFKDIRPMAGGVSFSGDSTALARANLWLRTAARVLVRIGSFHAAHLSELHKKSSRVKWGEYLDTKQPIRIKSTCRKSKIYHSKAAAQRVAKGIAEKMGLSNLPDFSGNAAEHDPESSTVFLRIEHDRCTLSIDSSGDNLHRRGYRKEMVRAPLRENLAAATLMLGKWDSTAPLADPLCGSGTIPIEAAMLAANIPPGANRDFAFLNWASFDKALWLAELKNAQNRRRRISAPILASDRDSHAVEITQRNAARAGVDEFIETSCHPAAQTKLNNETGLIVCNPPYGERIGNKSQLHKLYASLGSLVHANPGWRLALLTSSEKLARSTRLKFTTISAPFPNGGLRIKLYST
jgi:putative N6-adenine-specific DNA methylase